MKEGEMIERRLFRTKAAGMYLGFERRKILQLAHDGEIPYIEERPGSPWLFDVRDLDKWIESHKQTND